MHNGNGFFRYVDGRSLQRHRFSSRRTWFKPNMAFLPALGWQLYGAHPYGLPVARGPSSISGRPPSMAGPMDRHSRSYLVTSDIE